MNSYNKFPNVSVVIPTKNGGILFEQVIEKVKQQNYDGNIEIIIVDSGSSDKTLDVAYNLSDRFEQIPPEKFNHGLTRNYGIEISTGEIIILMTQDALPGNNQLIHNLVVPFSDPDVGGVYAKQIARPEADVLTKRNLENWLTGRQEFEVRQLKDHLLYEQLSPFDKYKFCNFDNVCSAVRRSAWEKVPFIENNFGEDIEWCLRTLKTGWKIAYQPEAFVIHSHDRSIFYEYKRTYMCHQKLYQLFQLQCIPSLKLVFRSMIYATLTDWHYVLIHEPRLAQKLKLMLRIPGLSIASAWGQYRGAMDEKLQKSKKISGV
jgi:cellulose synthase/poly-beta-1,6-N-acetylglucosamine synthase-like glycosyltransferase